MIKLQNLDIETKYRLNKAVQGMNKIMMLPTDKVKRFMDSYVSLPIDYRLVIEYGIKDILSQVYKEPVVISPYSYYNSFIPKEFKKVTDNLDFVTLDKDYSELIHSKAFDFTPTKSASDIPVCSEQALLSSVKSSLTIPVYSEQTLLSFLDTISTKFDPTTADIIREAILFKMKQLDCIDGIFADIGERGPYTYRKLLNCELTRHAVWEKVIEFIKRRNATMVAASIYSLTHLSLIKYQTYLQFIEDYAFKEEVEANLQLLREQGSNGVTITPPIECEPIEGKYGTMRTNYYTTIKQLGGDTALSEDDVMGVMHTPNVDDVDINYEKKNLIHTVTYMGDKYGLCKKHGKIYGVSNDGDTVIEINPPKDMRYEFVNQLAQMIPSGYGQINEEKSDSEIIKTILDTNLI